MGLVVVVLGFFMATFAGNVIWRRQRSKNKRKVKNIHKNENIDPLFNVLEDTEQGAEKVQHGFFVTTVGAILHIFYFLQARFFRLFSYKSRSNSEEKSLNRIEPIFDDEKTKRAKGIRVIHQHTMAVEEFFAKIIFLNAGSMNTAALLLNSKSNRFPTGLGNDSDQ
ncbi:hypothetical protein, partial [Streptomyces lacrimifluminis]|uniref:hypothetical protein n=1 Tax=Streptomyces lacrimifluminis TaxID=1500077 RepID=UPI0031ED3DA0